MTLSIPWRGWASKLMYVNDLLLVQHLQEADCSPYKHLDNFDLCPGYYYFSHKGYVDTLVSLELLPLYQKLAGTCWLLQRYLCVLQRCILCTSTIFLLVFFASHIRDNGLRFLSQSHWSSLCPLALICKLGMRYLFRIPNQLVAGCVYGLYFFFWLHRDCQWIPWQHFVLCKTRLLLLLLCAEDLWFGVCSDRSVFVLLAGFCAIFTE